MDERVGLSMLMRCGAFRQLGFDNEAVLRGVLVAFQKTEDDFDLLWISGAQFHVPHFELVSVSHEDDIAILNGL